MDSHALAFQALILSSQVFLLEMALANVGSWLNLTMQACCSAAFLCHVTHEQWSSEWPTGLLQWAHLQLIQCTLGHCRCGVCFRFPLCYTREQNEKTWRRHCSKQGV